MQGCFLHLAILAMWLPLSSAYAQNPNPNIPRRPIRTDDRQRLTLPAEAPAQPPAAPQTPVAPKAARKSCTLLIARENANRQLVIDENGVYQHRVRRTELRARLGSSNKPVLRCDLWDGVFPPKVFETVEFNVSEVRFAEKPEFDAVVNGSGAPAASRSAADDQFEE